MTGDKKIWTLKDQVESETADLERSAAEDSGAVQRWRLVAVDRRGGIHFRHRPGAVPAYDDCLVMLRSFKEYCLQPLMG